MNRRVTFHAVATDRQARLIVAEGHSQAEGRRLAPLPLPLSGIRVSR